MKTHAHVPTLVRCAVAFCLAGATTAASQTAADPQAGARTRIQTEKPKPETTTPEKTTQPDKATVQPRYDQVKQERVEGTAKATERVRAAHAAKAQGSYQEAAQTYEAALREVPAADTSTRAQVSIAYAQMLESWSQTAGSAEPANAARATKASELYRSALEAGTPPQRQLARNNLGNLLLRQGQYADALSTLQQLDLAAEPERRFLYEYNLGRALELSGRRTDAFDRYLSAVKAQPAFAPPREAATQLLVSEKPLNVARVETLAMVLIAQRQPAAGADVTRAALKAGGDAAAERLLRVLMRAYVGMSIEPAGFQRDEVPFLKGISESSRVRGYTDEIQRAVLDPDLPVIGRAIDAERLFRVWTDNDATELAALLKHIGDVNNREGRHRAALARYSAAWAIDRGNGDAAVYAAMLLQDHPELDPGQKALNVLLEDIFATKSALRAKRDWPNALRMHLVLGTIFERLGRWGPETDPRTASFQWRLALDAEERILKQDRSFSRSPGLYLKLGEAYMHLDPPKPDLARQQFLNAARWFDETGRAEEAEDARKRASTAAGRAVGARQ